MFGGIAFGRGRTMIATTKLNGRARKMAACTRSSALANHAKIVRGRDAQCNSEESP